MSQRYLKANPLKERLKVEYAKLRLALRTGQLPYMFYDIEERDYRKVIYRVSKELKQKFSVNKRKDLWIVDISTASEKGAGMKNAQIAIDSHLNHISRIKREQELENNTEGAKE